MTDGMVASERAPHSIGQLRFGAADPGFDQLEALRIGFEEDVERFTLLPRRARIALRDRLVRSLPEELVVDVVAAFEEAQRRDAPRAPSPRAVRLGRPRSARSAPGRRPRAAAGAAASDDEPPSADVDALAVVSGVDEHGAATARELEDAERGFLDVLAAIAVRAMLGDRDQ